ncbi:hypothetical protein ANCCEY_13224 [Ancylostoma ceylanicum]|uniref:Uncharacterized protein n=1 Tax=Ancylostoma ceylanicum TaxID=53326 RepID=A0A0D6LJ89_9BILA|nr:hypothetical protein ANCCEY_13224 [Ancylostoma ceylanicum]
MEELEEVLRNSEMEKKRLEEERTREQELVSNALAISEEITGKSTEISGATSSSPGTNSEDPKQTVPSRATASNERNLRSLSKQGRENSASGEEIRSASTIRKQQRPNNEETQSANMPNSVGKDLKETTGSKLSSVEAPPENQQPIERPSSKRSAESISCHKKALEVSEEYLNEDWRGKDGLPPASKRTGSQSGERRQSKSTSSKEKRPSTEGRKRAEEADVGKKANIAEDDLGIVHGPREKNLYDVNALLQEPSRLNSATVRSREEYLRIRRDRLLAMKASEREKQMNEVSQRAAQERPRTAKAARGLMRGSRVAIETDEVLAARRAILEKLRTEIDGTTDS